MEGVPRDRLFVALTRPQTIGGVTYSVCIANGVAATELFLLFRSPLILLAAVLVHAAAAALSVREPRIFDLWLTRVARCPRVRNHAVWQCNCYRP